MEWEWIVTLATIEPEDIDYTDYVQTAKQLVPELQEEVYSCQCISLINDLPTSFLSL